MTLLHIFDSSDRRIVQTAGARGVVNKLPIADGNDFVSSMDALVASGDTFDRILFETHGSPGRIYFGGKYISSGFLRGCTPRHYTRLTTPNARVYFNGCNVAAGSEGWDFLEAAAALFVTPGGGEVFGQTSLGFGNPFNGHVVHFWGVTRTLYVAQDGSILERFEQ
jgi:hypothetical protein